MHGKGVPRCAQVRPGVSAAVRTRLPGTCASLPPAQGARWPWEAGLRGDVVLSRVVMVCWVLASLSLPWHEKNNHIWKNKSDYSILLNTSNNGLIKDIKISLLFTLVNVTQSIT